MRILNQTLLLSFSLTLLVSCGHGSKSVNDQGVNIAYTDEGHGDTTLLFIHGWDLDKSYWSNQVTHFKDHYRVVAMDLPGFGESGTNRSDWTAQAYATDVDTLISQLNLQHVVLIGHSMSGDIALLAALGAPTRIIGLVGVDNFKNIKPETEQEKEDDARMMTVFKKGYQEAAIQFFKDDLFYTTTPDSIKRRILTDVINADSAIAIAALSAPVINEAQSLESYGKPLYLINSDYKTTDTAAFTAAHIPYDIQYIREVGHFPMVEKPDAFNADLDKVLGKIGH
jgi:pimeloyl-ACP methyl ester carboxylesterase